MWILAAVLIAVVIGFAVYSFRWDHQRRGDRSAVIDQEARPFPDDRLPNALALAELEQSDHYERSRFVWRFHIATWAGLIGGAKVVVDVDSGVNAPEFNDVAVIAIMTLGAVVGIANIIFLRRWHAHADAQTQLRRLRLRIRIQAELDLDDAPTSGDNDGWVPWAQVAEMLMTVALAVMFITVVAATVGG